MYSLPTYDQLLQQTLTDFQNQIPGCDVSAGSDIDKKAVVIASALQGEYEHQDYIRKQIFAKDADSEHLERHGAEYDIFRKAPSKASGSVIFTGQNGNNVPIGTQAVDANGVAVETTGTGNIAGGTVTLAAQAVTAGLSGNLALGDSLTVQNPPPGVDLAATVADNGGGAGFTGGTDVESDDSLRARIEDRKQHPPAGGNAHDYIAWARSVPGVEVAYCYPLRQGLGTATTVILTSGVGAARIPGPALVATVQAYIDGIRPVTAKLSQVLAPTAKPVAVTDKIKVKPGYTTADVIGWVQAAVQSFLEQFAPMEEGYLLKLQAAISDVEGVLDHQLSLPAASVVPNDDVADIMEMITPGVITITEWV